MIVVNQPTEAALPLEHTDVVAQVCGPLVSVAVTQRFGNPFADPVELAYLFPLPPEAAIVDFELRIGQRVVRGDLQEREAARKTYAEARAEGKRAGLLEQRRPNLFSVELANVQPGETIVATMRYHERLRYDDGAYEFVFPMGITPKFHANPAEASAVDAPIAAVGSPVGPVELSLAVDAGGSAADPSSPSHAIDLTRLDARRFSVRLLGDVLPNKDFVLRYAVAAETLRAAAWTTPGNGGSTVLVTALPPRLTDEAEPSPREFLFVIDRSGSMSGGPIDQARNALRACLRALGPQDTFAIQAFDDKIEWLAAPTRTSLAALPVTQATVEQADRWLAGIDARGGTDIVGALEAALQLPADAERQRYVVFLTDGAVSAEDAALSRVERHLGQVRLFTFGIGPSVNRGLLARMAERGRGSAEFLQLDEDIETAIMRFQDRVAYPVLQDIRLAWEGATAWDIYPERLPDLYNGQPLELVARFQPTGASRLIISGRRDRQPIRLEVDLPPTPVGGSAAEPMIANAWARARVTALLDSIRDDTSKTGALRGEIIGLAIQHRLVTPYTAFVAVDSQAPEQQGGEARRVTIAQPLPEGLDIDGFRGGSARSIASSGAGIALSMSAPAPIARPPSGQAVPPPPAKSTGLLGSMFRDRRQHAAKPAAPAAEPAAMKERAAEAPLDLDLSEEIAAPAAVSAQPQEQEQPQGHAGGRDDTLRWLARGQNVAGSWGVGDAEIEMTAAALLAFIRAGHTTRAGHYRRQLARALKWLRASGDSAGSGSWAARARAQALAEMAAAIGDSDLQREADALAQTPIQAPAALLASLDDLRAAALLRAVRPLAPGLLSNDQSGLARAWLAALTD
jgi:Ca-activated chloride channel family protein